ncbi:Fur family transcriptional regulator [Piscinibacter sp.]|uniref:Fur family transcriptional regulator n=1 Tax=Piscinibacter sp. TaxID=1903157 RepID=UPI0039E235B8
MPFALIRSAEPDDDGTLTALLLARGLKPTPIRLFVLKALRDGAPDDGCLTPDEVCRAIYQRGDKASVPQVYNVLSLLADSGIIDRFRLGAGPALYCLRRGPPWSALEVCNRCGHARGMHNRALDAQLRRVAQASNFQLSGHTVILHGLCPQCAAAGRRSA